MIHATNQANKILQDAQGVVCLALTNMISDLDILLDVSLMSGDCRGKGSVYQELIRE